MNSSSIAPTLALMNQETSPHKIITNGKDKKELSTESLSHEINVFVTQSEHKEVNQTKLKIQDDSLRTSRALFKVIP